ncbi:stage II sporulation protein D [Orenia metallireducens]|uniref:Stage II sporulation protein D n=2 Tax=Orenia metallireducens TaxID=1413210 RepID=A0A285GZL2_9FIRM|nr:stage II sporulation protein D [Orenia metallireducens]SNY29019.1 stage II sporulation protein D [Orenia metallireducens]
MMMKLLKRSIILLAIVILTGCGQQGTQGEEPTIQVKLVDGQINKINIEEYVAGVVAGEMKKGWLKNAYAAQAIIARTFTLKRLEENGNNTISARHEEAQAYRPENISSEIREAVKMTRGEVATYQDKYIQGWFHSSAGGQTTSAKVGLAYKEAEPPYVQSVESPDDAAPRDIQNWQVSIGREEIAVALEKAGERMTQIKDIKVLKRDSTGRIIQIAVIHDQGSKELQGAEFRTLIGPDKLKSTLIKSIEKSGDKFIFTGSGYGHGVGMSQWGAYKLAKEGKTPEEIVNYYFKDVKIVKKWD